MINWDREADLVVVGSGAAGMSAAIVAAASGLDALVLEKTDRIGGSTAISGGVVWVPGNRGMAEAGAPDSPSAALRYLEQVIGPALRRDMIETYVRVSPEMVDWFNSQSAVRLAPRMYAPDYQSELDGASQGGRALDPLEYDGRKLGRWFDRLRAPLPQTMIFGGMMVSRADIDHLQRAFRSWTSFRHAVRILLGHARDRLRFARGARLLAGNALAARLLRSAVDRGVRFETGADVTALLSDGGAVIGAEAVIGGETVRIRARRGVVLAAGGGAANAHIRAAHVPHADVHLSMAPEGSAGDGLALAVAAGGTIGETVANAVFLTPVSVDAAGGKRTLFPHLILDRQKPGLIAVNSAGRRFVNEADSYHDFVEGMYRDQGDGPAIPAWLIADSRFVRKYGLGLVRPAPFSKRGFIRSGYLVSARTIDELAAKVGVPKAQLAATIEAANQAASTGFDPTFGKGSSGYNRYLGDASHSPNPCLGPIRTPPFHAVRIWPGDIGAARGIRTDVDARVLDAQGEPIRGLYACGNDMHSIMGGSYPAGGITLGPAMTFGFIAARHASGNSPRGSEKEKTA
ncbi:FAD-dependent oxidoreductase [Sphingomonas sp.]|uniref:FAD-dependent oxidoreductase n=1 Tax=Sphingomonas sp. TaxID=28214 RepID=UPI0017BEC5A3|nr:FAD-dependent oxidoreductase [Sphingomonas sp.]MBA4763173.1 FAD-dependent oxidoreductase [Sphingomonas sp.]